MALFDEFSDNLNIKSKEIYVSFVENFCKDKGISPEELLDNFALYIYFYKKTETRYTKKTLNNHISYLNKFRTICGEDTSNYFYFEYKVKYNFGLNTEKYFNLKDQLNDLNEELKKKYNVESKIRIEKIEDGCLIFELGIDNIFGLSKDVFNYIARVFKAINQGKRFRKKEIPNLVFDGIIIALRIGGLIGGIFASPVIFKGTELSAELISTLKDYFLLEKRENNE